MQLSPSRSNSNGRLIPSNLQVGPKTKQDVSRTCKRGEISIPPDDKDDKVQSNAMLTRLNVDTVECNADTVECNVDTVRSNAMLCQLIKFVCNVIESSTCDQKS